jgi:hypothetical protein
MWTCPKCRESIEDQFDSCWNCGGAAPASTLVEEQCEAAAEATKPPEQQYAGAAKPQPPTQYFWMWPVISVVSSVLLDRLALPFWHYSSKTGEGHFSLEGVLLGAVGSWVAIWAFLRCPICHWFAKILTVPFLIVDLNFSLVMAESYLLHGLGYDYGGDSTWPIEVWPWLGLLSIYALAVWAAGELALSLWRVVRKVGAGKRERG